MADLEIQELKSQLSHERENAAQKTSTINSLESELETANQDNRRLKESLIRLQSDKQSLEGKLSDATSELQLQREQNLETTREKESLETKLQGLQKQLDMGGNLQASLSAQIQELTNQCATLQKSLNDANQTIGKQRLLLEARAAEAQPQPQPSSQQPQQPQPNNAFKSTMQLLLKKKKESTQSTPPAFSSSANNGWSTTPSSRQPSTATDTSTRPGMSANLLRLSTMVPASYAQKLPTSMSSNSSFFQHPATTTATTAPTQSPYARLPSSSSTPSANTYGSGRPW